MNRASIFLLFTIFTAFLRAQESTYYAKVLDADTGEPMPCVGIRVSNENTTLTNFDGEFCIKALPTDSIRLSFIGYETLYLRADQMARQIEMHAAERRLAEVTVQGWERLMTKISKKAVRVYERKRNQRSQYFFRQTIIVPQKQDIVEAFIDARSAVNLRNIRFVTGRHGAQTQELWEKSNIGNMNLHHVLELAPMIMNNVFWFDLTTPLSEDRSIKEYLKTYSIEVEELVSDGRDIYKIDLSPAEGVPASTRILTGSLYVDKSDLSLLAFDGDAKNMWLDISNQDNPLQSGVSIPLTLNVHIDYSYDKGYPEVTNLTMRTDCADFHTRAMMFSMGKSGKNRPKGSKMNSDDNMLSTIEVAGYDSTFWENNEVIKRTEEEQRIAEGIISEKKARKDSIQSLRDNLPPLEKFAERARLFGERIPQEKVFVQMDNTCYFLGDTIWFSAFTRRTNSGRPSKISRVLYAELWNHDGFLVERKLVEMRDGRGSGFFALPDTLYSGYFELRAYTRWQLNWGQTEHPHNKYSELWFYNKAMAKDFFRDYEKLYSRVFPVYDKPKVEGEYNRDMTLRPLRRYFKKDPEPPKLLLSLFPEGGNMVAGMPCRVAFEAALEDGEYCEGTVSLLMKNEKLKIKDEKGEEVTEVMTENRGRGSFTFTPEEGKSYEAVFTSSDGKTAKQKIKDLEKEGVSLQVSQQGDEWVLDIHTNLDKPLGMTIMHEGVTSRFAQIKNEIIKIKNEELKAGINQVTIFDEEGRVWADRLFFVTKPELTKPTIAVTGLKEEYGPFEPVELDVKCKMSSVEDSTPRPLRERMGEGPGAGLSLSIRDAVRQDNTFDSGNIMTEMLLASEIKGFVPQSEWFFEKDDEEHRRALDLLMMTQGWRRFAWREMALPGAWEITHSAEQSQMVTGTVNRYYVENPNTYDRDPYALYIAELSEHYSNMENLSTQDTPVMETGSHGWDNTDYNALVKNYGNYYTDERIRNIKNSEQRFEERGNIKKEVQVHAEIVKLDNQKERFGIVGDVTTKKGKFKMELPRFYGDCLFFVTAKDTTLWHKKGRNLLTKKFRQHNWIQMETSEYERIHEDAEFYVRLNFPHPRWVKPYSYYQVHYAALRDEPSIAKLLTDGTHLLDEVTIRARRNGRRKIDLSKPVYVVDAYEACNATMDAGLLTHVYKLDKVYLIAKNYIGDMGMSRAFDYSLYYDSLKMQEIRPHLRLDKRDTELFPLGDEYKWTNFTANNREDEYYQALEYLDKIYIYSDYSPRREGDERFSQDNQPSVDISLHKMPNQQRRVTYRDRRYVLHGFAYQEDFYHPDYKRNLPKAGQKDHRRTLYWNPDLKLDENGEAHVTLYNNSRRTQIKVEANGMTSEGQFLYNK